MSQFNRRQFAAASAAALTLRAVPQLRAADDAPGWRLGAFAADITPPPGHPLLGGLRPPAKSIKDRLSARGVMLVGTPRPLVICGLDWCELRNGAYDRFRDALATATGTDRQRVLLTCLHQHD